MIRLQQRAGCVIDTRHGDLITDFRLQQALFSIRQLGLRFQYKKDRAGSPIRICAVRRP